MQIHELVSGGRINRRPLTVLAALAIACGTAVSYPGDARAADDDQVEITIKSADIRSRYDYLGEQAMSRPMEPWEEDQLSTEEKDARIEERAALMEQAGPLAVTVQYRCRLVDAPRRTVRVDGEITDAEGSRLAPSNKTANLGPGERADCGGSYMGTLQTYELWFPDFGAESFGSPIDSDPEKKYTITAYLTTVDGKRAGAAGTYTGKIPFYN